MRETLNQGGIDSSRHILKRDAAGTQSFRIGYLKGPTSGSVFVNGTHSPDGVRLSIVVQEHKTVR
jgi:hypothetical protein